MAAIVFDLDGTLVDSAPDIHAAVNRMLAGENRGPLDLATVTSFVGNGLPHLVARVIAHTGLDMADHPRLTRATLTAYEAAASVHTRLYPGVARALQTLAEAGHRLGICTNKPEAPARQVLHDFGLAGLFDVVVGGDSLTARKPDPAPLWHVFDALGDADARLFVGDSEVDAETARAAAVPFLLFTEGYRKAPVDSLPHTARYDDATQLPALVARVQRETRPAG